MAGPAGTDVTLLDGDSARSFTSLTFPLYAEALRKASPNGPVIAAAALDHGAPAGLAVGGVKQGVPEVGGLLSVLVLPQHRRGGLATRLVAEVEGALSRAGCREIEVVYLSDRPFTEPLERILERRGFPAATPRMVVCEGLIETFATAPWLAPRPLPQGYEIFPWVELTEEDRESIRERRRHAPWFPDKLSPFEDAGCEPVTSLGLRVDGRVEGWLLTHRIDDETVRYTTSFVREDLARLGRSVLLYAEACVRQRAAGIPNVVWATPVSLAPMVRFIKRRFGPYLTRITESREARKALPEVL